MKRALSKGTDEDVSVARVTSQGVSSILRRRELPASEEKGSYEEIPGQKGILKIYKIFDAEVTCGQRVEGIQRGPRSTSEG